MDPLPSPPASAQVLSNSDLLHGIFMFVPLSSAHCDGHLAQCATICRTFHEPAIRVLWRYLDMLLPLWHILAPSSTSFPVPRSFGGPLHETDVLAYLQKVISAQLYLDPRRWTRFLWHAAHVRGIVHCCAPIEQALNDANHFLIRAVFTQSGGNAILPLLHSIEWCNGFAFQPDILIPFFSSTLRRATIDFSQVDDAVIVSVLRQLHESSPFLELIHVNAGFERSQDGGLSLVEALICFARLRIIYISPIQGSKSFRALVRKPNLTHLYIFQATGSWVGLGHAISVNNLRELSVVADVSVLSALFVLVHFRVLRCVTITVGLSPDSRITADDIPAILALFYNAVSASTLESFDFVLGAPVHRTPGTQPLLRDLLAPILPIHTLRSFGFGATCMHVGLSISDADIEALAGAWPEIECLSLLPYSFSEGPRLSLNVVHHLHRHCPYLQDLSIPPLSWPVIGVHSIPPPQLDHSPHHSLRHLSFEHRCSALSEILPLPPWREDEDAEAIARYLLDLFPNLDPQRYKRQLDDLESTGGLWGTLRADDVPGPLLLGRWTNVVRHIYAICSAHKGS